MAAPNEFAVFLLIRSICGVLAVYPERSGFPMNELYMTVAAASCCVIGGIPSSISMVRSIDTVVYIVLST